MGDSAGEDPADGHRRDDERGDDEWRDGERSDGGVPPRQAQPLSEDFDWRGWVLVAVLVFSLVLVPAALLVLPEAQGVVAALGLTLRDAYLVLPLLPAFLLGATAVWAAVRARQN